MERGHQVKLTASQVFKQQCSEWVTAAQCSVALVSVRVEDERTFSVLSFVRNTLRKRLTTHLEDVVRIKYQQEYTTSTFDYSHAKIV